MENSIVKRDPLVPTIKTRLHARLPENKFAELMQAINARGGIFKNHQIESFPQMEISALYCLAFTVNEYAQYLNPTMFDPEMNTSEKLAHVSLKEKEKDIIKKYKKRKTKHDVTTDVFTLEDDNV